MVVGDFFIVHATEIQYLGIHFGGIIAKTRMSFQAVNQSGYLVEYICRNVTATCSWIGNRLIFI